MASAPNERLAGLVSVLGDADTRELVALFLDSFAPLSLELASGDRGRCHRASHSLKSSAQQMGISTLADRMAKLEKRLSEPDGAVTAADLEGVAADFAQAEGPLRAFVGG